MEVILKKDVPNLGLKNEVVTVKNGYGVNYLIPQGFAIIATDSAKKQHAETMKQRAHKEEKIKNEAIEMASKLENVKLSIATKASSTGKSSVLSTLFRFPKLLQRLVTKLTATRLL